MALKQPPATHSKNAMTGKGQVAKPPNNLPNSKATPVTGKS